MGPLQFPLRFLDAVRLRQGDDGDRWFVVGLYPDLRRRTFMVQLMTAPDGLSTCEPLTNLVLVGDADERVRVAFRERLGIPPGAALAAPALPPP